jgi:hypothetical protein
MPNSSIHRAKYVGGVAVCLLFGWIRFVRATRVPLLSLVDLGFHELGHLLTYPGHRMAGRGGESLTVQARVIAFVTSP